YSEPAFPAAICGFLWRFGRFWYNRAPFPKLESPAMATPADRAAGRSASVQRVLPMTTIAANPAIATTGNLTFGGARIHRNLPVAALIETAIRRGEGVLAANGALNVDTGERTGRSPNDKFLEDTPGIHDNIAWGKVNQPVTPDAFAKL